MSLEEALGTRRAARAARLLGEAAEAFDEERFTDARRIVAPLAKEAPDVPDVRHLHGVVLYRLGRWKEAQRELEDAYALTRDVSSHPILMDCARALGDHALVGVRWDELGAVSPDPATMAEGRIVRAGSLADSGDLAGAVSVLSKDFRRPARPAEHHLRRAYALADLLERAGEHVEARALFAWVVSHDPHFADAAERAAALA